MGRKVLVMRLRFRSHRIPLRLASVLARLPIDWNSTQKDTRVS